MNLLIRTDGFNTPLFRTGLLIILMITFFSILPAENIFAQQTGVQLSGEIQNLERQITSQGVSAAQRHAALVRLASLRQLSGDIEGAARNWLEAAAAKPGSVDDEALLSCAYCLAAMGEWERAAAVLVPLVSRYPRAHFLDVSIRAIQTGDHSALVSLAGSQEYAALRPQIFFILWKISQGASKENWKQRLVNEFPDTPESRLVREDSSAKMPSVVIMPSPFWLFAGGLDSLLLIEETAGLQPPQVTSQASPVTAQTSQTAAAVTQSSSSQTSNTQTSSARLQTGLFSRHANALSQEASLRRAGFSPSIEARIVNVNEMWAVTVPSGTDQTRTITQLRDAGFESFPVR